MTFVSATSNKGSCTGTGTITCNLSDIAPNSTATVNIVVKPATAGASLTNRANVASAITDPKPENNSAEQVTRVSALPSIAGRIAFANGAAASGVRVNMTGTETATVQTGNDGKYQFAEVRPGGNYTVTPVRPGYAFRSPSQSFNNVTLDQTADFTAISCQFSIAPVIQGLGASGGTGTIAVTAPDSQCPWTARATVPWITITSPVAGNGSGTVTFNVSATTAGRSGTIIVAGNTFTLWQEANSCGVPGFKLPVQINAGTSGPVVAADFNKDGKLDLAVTGDRRLSILLGATTGIFAQPVTVTVASQPRAIAIGDFTGDNIADLAIGHRPENTGTGFRIRLTLLPGNGQGGFGTATTSEMPNVYESFAVGDLDNDGRLDLVGSPAGDYSGRSDGLSILFNNGNGTFRLAMKLKADNMFTIFAAGGLSPSIADLNGDGKPDIAFSPDRGWAVVVAFGNGTGVTWQMRAYPLNPSTSDFQTRSTAVADFNSDGRPDLLTACHDGLIEILLGDGTGKFTSPIQFTIGSSPLPSVGDFNGDGKADLAVARSLAESVTILLNSCSASGAAASVSAASYLGPELATDSIATAFGAGMATTTRSAATLPLPTELGGTRVTIRDSVNAERLAQLFYVSPGQVNYLVPEELTIGPATVTITNSSGAVSAGSIFLSSIRPGLFSANADGQGVPAAVVLRVKGDGATSYEPVAVLDPATNKFVPRPIDLGPATDRVFLVMFGTGIRNRSQFTNLSLRVGEFDLQVSYAGRQGDLAGLDQVNALLPRSLAGRGELDMVLNMGFASSNILKINVK